MTLTVTTYSIQLMDKAGFEAHFVRFVHMTLFDQDGVADQKSAHTIAQIFEIVSVDAFLLLTIILPLFIAAMHYYTAPYKYYYASRVQTLALPLAIVPFFFFQNWDVAILSGFVLILNGYITWQIIDREEFGGEEKYDFMDDDDAAQSRY